MSKESWREDSRYVIEGMKRLEQNQSRIQNDITDIKSKIATIDVTLQLKSGLWGGVAAVITIIAAIMLKLIR